MNSETHRFNIEAFDGNVVDTASYMFSHAINTTEIAYKSHCYHNAGREVFFAEMAKLTDVADCSKMRTRSHVALSHH